MVITKWVASIVSIHAPAKLIVPRQVWAISSCVLDWAKMSTTSCRNHLRRTCSKTIVHWQGQTNVFDSPLYNLSILVAIP